MISYVLGGRLRTSKWPSRSVKMLRNIPAACDFNFTATWLAGRLFAFKSTVPEIFPSLLSNGELWAPTMGVQAIKARFREKLRKRILWLPLRGLDVSAVRNSYSICTDC